MCCKITVSVYRAEAEAFTALVHEVWGKPHDSTSVTWTDSVEGWLNPTRKLTGGTFAEVDMDGAGHEVEPLSVLCAIKWAVGLYEEALRRGLSPRLEQCGVPCSRRFVAKDGETPVDIDRFCKAGLEGLDA